MRRSRTRVALGFFLATHAALFGAVMPDFSPRVEVEGVPLFLQNTGIFKARVFFSVYAAGLYLGDGVRPEQVLEDVPKRLELHYFYKIPASVMVEEGENTLAANISPRQLEGLRPRLSQLNDAYRDVMPGERYALTYIPGRGTELSLNGEVVCRIDGADFAAAYFRIWLGEKPASRALKKALLADPA